MELEKSRHSMELMPTFLFAVQLWISQALIFIIWSGTKMRIDSQPSGLHVINTTFQVGEEGELRNKRWKKITTYDAVYNKVFDFS